MAVNRPFERRWFMCDYARQRSFVRDEFILWLDTLQRLGYNGLGIYLEGAFDFESIPGVIRDGVMTREDAKWAAAEGKKRGIFVFPMTNVVGHMEHYFRQERFRDLLMKDTNYMQLNFFDERAEEFVMNIVHEYEAAFGNNFVHIGGDETKLTPEQKVPYAQFLAKICKNLLDEGIKPAIWNDMIWMDEPLIEYFDRRTFIFDWSYYGHRPESPKYFKELGFDDIVVCPCDNSWEGFITYQHVTGYLKASRDMAVKPNEVEAFFEDARNAQVYGGLLTNWNNETGRNMWAQWTAFARGGLYMNGRLDAREENDELIEMSLFGRVTPYTEVTRIFQEDIPYQGYFRHMRNCLFYPSGLQSLYEYSMQSGGQRDMDFIAAAEKAEKLLDTWIPQGEFERNCCTSMYGVAAMVKASAAVLAAFDMHKLYTKAAQVQFDSPETAAQMLDRISGTFRRAINEVEVYAAVHAKAIEPTGHSRNDLILLGETTCILEEIADIIDTFRESLDRIPLTRFERIVDRAINGKFIYT